jgi:hypothetical protein
MKFIRLIAASAYLVLLCSCAAQNLTSPGLPTETSFNEKMCRGDLLLLELHLEDGEKLWFVVDTGVPDTLLDKSLEPKLGKPLGAKTINSSFYPKTQGHVYAAPRLYLGNTTLLTGSRVTTMDMSQIPYPFHRLSGVLGMDCLRHYCFQLDFTARKIRFFDPDKLKTQDLGTAFPLSFHNGIFSGTVFTRADCFGSKNTTFCVDTGMGGDGLLTPELFQRAARAQIDATNTLAHTGSIHTLLIGGQRYTNLMIYENHAAWPTWNYIGIEFLARHLVTFNFPKRTMYLKQTSVGSLADESTLTNRNNTPAH